MRLPYAAVLLAALAVPALAQSGPAPGNCSLGLSQNDLNVADVFARVFNTGSLFYGNTTTAGNGYFVPRATDRSPVFAAGLWLGGIVEGETTPRVAGALYSNFAYWPGPLGADGRPVNPASCAAFDRIYRVSRQNILDYEAGQPPAPDLAAWPWQLGAPVTDGDGNSANYNLAGGDRPTLRGEQMLWWLMNDVGNFHAGTNSLPLGVEVRVEAFTTTLAPFGQTTFYRYAITNRTSRALDPMYASLFSDPDLGDYLDDYVGSDPAFDLAYAYNAGPADAVYGIPPAFGIQILDGPAAADGTRLRMTSMSYFENLAAGPTSDPRSAPEMFNFMRGLWGDGTPMRARGNGYGQPTTAQITRFAFSGDPVAGTGWTERTPGTGTPNPGGDRRMVSSVGPFRLGPGETQELVLAMPFAQGTSHLNSVTRLRALAAEIRTAYAAGAFGAPLPVSAEDAPVAAAFALSGPHPNPSAATATLRAAVPAGATLRAVVLDVLGREVGTATVAGDEVRVPTGALPAGVYAVRVEARLPDGTAAVQTRLLTVAR